MSIFNKVTKTFQWGQHSVTMETGEIARQSGGAVIVNIEDTVVLATVVASKSAKPGQDFFPLTVDYIEKTYAAGKIPGSFFKREAKPSEHETLTSRLIDRPIRPLFPEGFYNEVHVVVHTLSLNPEVDSDIAALIASKIGVGLELVSVTSANRIPYLQTKKADLVISTLGKNAEREKVIDFTVAYSPFYQAVFGPKAMTVKTPADLGGKTVAVTRGAMEDQELAKIAPATLDVKRFEDNAATVAAFVSGQTQLIATGASVAGNMMARNPTLSAEYKLLLKDSPNFIGVAKGEDKLRLKVNEILVDAKKSGELDRLAMKWLGRPAGDLPQ